MPILKVDPSTGQSLDKAKTPEQIAAETAANERFYSDRKKRIKTQSKKKKVEIIEDVQVVINPFTTSSNELVVNDLIEPFNKLLEPCEKFLKTSTSGYKITKDIKDENLKIILKRPKGPVKLKYDSDYSLNEHIPSGIEAIESAVTGVPLDDDIFQVKPTKVKPKKNVVVDRIFFNTIDVKNMLKYPKESQKVLLELMKGMLANIIYIKFLKTGNKYVGSTVASIAIPGKKNKYAINFKDETIEVRIWSDVTEIV